MSDSLYFYDLETSGFSPRTQRIMQFAGQRTDLELNPIGEPDNYMIKMTPEILPDPEAVLLTGITPQMTIADGLTEAEFLQIFSETISLPGTVFTGFNSIRFDDEFMRFLHYRNFYDAYEWQWADGRSRWDMLDVVRMTRALRPAGIKWPVNSDGQPANQLGLLTSVNKLDHANAHDALSDVLATISLARLIHQKQPKLFEYLFNIRSKSEVSKLIQNGLPFVYTSGKYATEHDKTTVVTAMFDSPKNNGVVVYDLRFDPTPFIDLKARQLSEMWQHYCKERPCPHQRLPVKTLQFNKCPAVAPISVLNEECQTRLELSLSEIEKYKKILDGQTDFFKELKSAMEIMDKKYQSQIVVEPKDVDARLYDGFVGGSDKQQMAQIRNAKSDKIKTLELDFSDERLTQLFPLYKARNFPNNLSEEENESWQKFCEVRLLEGKQSSRVAQYFDKLASLAEQKDLNHKKKYLLEELQLYGQSILPIVE